jgi:MFS transporter, DHA2 family, multidrug resistance protein
MARAKSKTRYERPRKKSTSDTPQKVAISEVEQESLRPSIALIIAVVLTAILEVLDITIVSVSIPHMLGSFGATSDQITWVLTSYLVAAAVGMPLTGYLSERLGRRRLLTISILGFVISSGLCGLSWNLFSMVLFRIAQGVSGAPLVALSQAILLSAFPREKHGQALAIFGLGIMVAPVLGPVLGGWLTDTFVWRAVFYVNIPIGLIALLLSLGELPRAPVKYLKTDWTGMALLVLTVGSLQLVLDQGPTRDWFDSRFIQTFSGIALFSGAAFLMRGWDNPRNIVDLRLLKDRNFASGLLASTAYGVPLFGTIALLPLLIQRLLGYPAMTGGLVFVPRALVSAISLAIAGGILMRVIDSRYLVGAGLVLTAIGSLVMAHLSLDVDAWGLIWPGMIAGAGMGLFFVPINAVAFATIPAAKLDEASGVMALMRNIGASIGIALVSWLLVRQSQIHWENLINHVNPFNPALPPYFSALVAQGLNLQSPSTMVVVAQEIGRQAQMLAFNNLFWFLGWFAIAMLPLLLVMKRPEKVGLVMA